MGEGARAHRRHCLRRRVWLDPPPVRRLLPFAAHRRTPLACKPRAAPARPCGMRARAPSWVWCRRRTLSTRCNGCGAPSARAATTHSARRRWTRTRCGALSWRLGGWAEAQHCVRHASLPGRHALGRRRARAYAWHDGHLPLPRVPQIRGMREAAAAEGCPPKSRVYVKPEDNLAKVGGLGGSHVLDTRVPRPARASTTPCGCVGGGGGVHLGRRPCKPGSRPPPRCPSRLCARCLRRAAAWRPS